MCAPTSPLQVWLEILDRIPAVLHHEIKGLGPDALAWQPDAEANNIAVTVWHIARALDWLGATVLGGQPAEEQIWHVMGWAERTGYDPRGHGHSGIGTLGGYTQAEVREVPLLAADQLLTYLDQSRDALRQRLAGLTAEELDWPAAGYPDSRSAYSFFSAALMDLTEHLGEIKAIKRMWERRQRIQCGNPFDKS